MARPTPHPRSGMKRSRRIALGIVGSVAAVAALSSCGNDDDSVDLTGEAMFRDVDECRESQDAETCRTAFADAQRQHELTAPKYASREECERDLGAGVCTPTNVPPTDAPASSSSTTAASHGGGWFMPALAGFLIGRSLGGVPMYYGPPPPSVTPNCPRTPTGNCQPASGSSSGSSGTRYAYYSGAAAGRSAATAGTGGYVGTVADRGGRATFSSPPPGSRAATGVANSVRRGGFGSTGRGYSGSSS